MTITTLHAILLFICTYSSLTFNTVGFAHIYVYIYNENTNVSIFCSIFLKGPFLVSMIGKSRNKESDILWVQGDPAEVLLMVSNPLSIELKVEKMVSKYKCTFVNCDSLSLSLSLSLLDNAT